VVISGQKMWTSLAQYADYIWLAARTDPAAKKHKGLSIFSSTSAEGFSRQEIRTVGGVGTNATFYDDVRVPAANLTGAENGGWKLITGQLNHERISLLSVGRLQRLLENVTAWARETEMDGRRVVDQPWVQQNLARAFAKVQVLRLMNWQQAWAATKGQPDTAARCRRSRCSVARRRSSAAACSSRCWRARHPRPRQRRCGAARCGESSYRNALILTSAVAPTIQRDIIAMAGMGCRTTRSDP
jgi:alkylation response protein AidB-like acyl-CoA dehydrogenase